MPKHAVIAATVHQWRHHLSVCIKADGAVFSSTVSDLDIVFALITTTFLAVVDQSNSHMLLGRFGSIAIVSYDFVLCNTWRLSNLQGKVAKLIRCGGLCCISKFALPSLYSLQ